MSYPDTQQDVSVKIEEWQVCLYQAQPASFQDKLIGKLTQQGIHMTLENAALLGARLLYLVAQAKEELEKDYG